MIIISDMGILNPKIIDILKDNKGQELKDEMIKIVNELYFPDDFDSIVLKEFINDFFNQYQPESSKREDYTDEEALLWRLGDLSIEEWNWNYDNRCKLCKKFPVMCGCGTPNTMET